MMAPLSPSPDPAVAWSSPISSSKPSRRRFLADGGARGLTLVHGLGVGDRDRRGTNRFAHLGMTRRVIGGHWTWSPKMQAMARDEQIEAYCLPSGAISLLLREIGARRPRASSPRSASAPSSTRASRAGVAIVPPRMTLSN